MIIRRTRQLHRGDWSRGGTDAAYVPELKPLYLAAFFICARQLIQCHRICTVCRFLNVSTVLGMMSTMSPYNYEQQAQAAMSMALGATGDDRQNWVQVAVAWWYLAQNAADHDRGLSLGQQGLAPVESVADSSAGAARIRVM